VDSLLTGTAAILDFLTTHEVFPSGTELGLLPLTGGVSSDIWLATGAGHQVVVKQPLADLRVADEWHASVERSGSEAAYLQVVGSLVPGTCPRVLAYDPVEHWLALEYLPPGSHTLWKEDLLAGRVGVGVASAVGDRLGTIHRLTSAHTELADRFATDDLFGALRVEPYLLRVLERHPEVADEVDAVVAGLYGTRQALVHGDVSPKNILVGPAGPVLLDAETAWWGDPAFDVAFCLNHLLLKCLLPTTPTDTLVRAAYGLVGAYQPHITWDDPEAVLTRVARLLPALLLARVDGRSPVEYLDEPAKQYVRSFALDELRSGTDGLGDLIATWGVAIP
jgi:tRNA A-37 threonylcarbamoyl transferase component Bud32